MVGGYLGGLAAGAADYLTIPDKSESRKVANAHAGLNLGIMGLYSLNVLLRRRNRPPTGPLTALLSLGGTAGLVASGWLGGELVYKLGMRVKPFLEAGEGPGLKLPGDPKLEQAFEKMEHMSCVSEVHPFDSMAKQPHGSTGGNVQDATQFAHSFGARGGQGAPCPLAVRRSRSVCGP
jgi:hypothetical protein